MYSPLGTQEHTANQVDVDAKTGRIAVDQVIVEGGRRRTAAEARIKMSSAVELTASVDQYRSA